MVLSWFFICCTSSFAKPVSIEKARQVAENWVIKHTGNQKRIAFLEEDSSDVITAGFTEEPTYHIFHMKGGGWVIVAADDVAFPIIGFSFLPTGSSNDQPPAFREWMTAVSKEIAYAARLDKNGQILASDSGRQDSIRTKIQRAWEQLEAGNTFADYISAAAEVSPLLETTWSQDKYYNTRCPEDSSGPDGHTLVGCAATALGQIMKYYNWPDTGTGTHSYTPSSHPEYGEQYVDFGSTTYQWSSMPSSGAVTSYNDAVATLLYHVGVALNMNYGPDGSGASISEIVPALQNYFRYETSGQKNRSSYSASDWEELLKADLDAARPIFYFGFGTGGHGFVCDGYKDNDYFHFNWGWNGYYNGYFYLNSLTPASYNFSNDQGAVLGIEPKQSGAETGPPSITDPQNGSTLSAASQTFHWNSNGTNVSEWWIYAGSYKGGKNYYNSGSLGTATSCTVTGLPTNGSTVFVRLWYKSGTWKYADFTYTAASDNSGGGSDDGDGGGNTGPPSITDPQNGSTLSAASQTFHWNSNGTNVSEWWIYAGSYKGGKNYYNSGSLGTATSCTVTGLPTNGSTVFVRLWYKSGTWKYADFTYTASRN